MPSNRTPKELNSLIGNEQLLYEELDKIINFDFTNYISVKFTDIDFIYQKKLFDMAFKLSEEGKNNWLIDLIIGSFAEIEIRYPIHIDIQKQSQIIDFLVQVHDFWKKNTVLTDFSDMLYYSFKHKVIDKEHIRGLVTDISPFNKMFSSYSRKEQIILFYIYINRMDEYFSRWDEDLLNVINNLNNQEFIDFLLGFGYIRNGDDNEDVLKINGKPYVIDFKFIKLAGDEYFDKISNVFDNRLDEIKDK